MKIPATWDSEFDRKLKEEVRKVVDDNPDMSHNELMWQIMQHETNGTMNPKLIDDILRSILPTSK